jgi:hypothetical protein
LRRLLFASAAAFSNTATIGVSLAASFYCFLSTVTEVEGEGTWAVSSFIAPSSLGNIKRVKQTKYTKTWQGNKHSQDKDEKLMSQVRGSHIEMQVDSWKLTDPRVHLSILTYP